MQRWRERCCVRLAQFAIQTKYETCVWYDDDLINRNAPIIFRCHLEPRQPKNNRRLNGYHSVLQFFSTFGILCINLCLLSGSIMHYVYLFTFSWLGGNSSFLLSLDIIACLPNNIVELHPFVWARNSHVRWAKRTCIPTLWSLVSSTVASSLSMLAQQTRICRCVHGCGIFSVCYLLNFGIFCVCVWNWTEKLCHFHAVLCACCSNLHITIVKIKLTKRQNKNTANNMDFYGMRSETGQTSKLVGCGISTDLRFFYRNKLRVFCQP